MRKIKTKTISSDAYYKGSENWRLIKKSKSSKNVGNLIIFTMLKYMKKCDDTAIIFDITCSFLILIC